MAHFGKCYERVHRYTATVDSEKREKAAESDCNLGG